MCLCTNKMSNQQATLATHEACNEPFSFMRSKIKLKWYCFISSLAHMNTKETTRGGEDMKRRRFYFHRFAVVCSNKYVSDRWTTLYGPSYKGVRDGRAPSRPTNTCQRGLDLCLKAPVVPAQPRRRGCPPRLKPPPEPRVVPRRRGRPRKDPPPAPPPAQLRRGRSAGLDPAHLGPQGLGGGM